MTPVEAGEPAGEEFRAGRTGLAYLAFLPWQADLVQGITLRRAGPGGGGALDLRRDESAARESSPGWRRFVEEWGAGARLVVGMEQVHGIRVRVVDPGAGASTGTPRILAACDGLVTGAPGVLLTATVADCVPLFLRDQDTGAIGLLHAGWRGVAGEILSAGLESMSRAFGTSSSSVSLYMGPSIAGACYPVGPDVLRRFDRWIDSAADPPAVRRLDLREIIARQALDLGLPRAGIVGSAFCTHCRTDLFYSHRAENGRCGRQAAFLGIRSGDVP